MTWWESFAGALGVAMGIWLGSQPHFPVLSYWGAAGFALWFLLGTRVAAAFHAAGVRAIRWYFNSRGDR